MWQSRRGGLRHRHVAVTGGIATKGALTKGAQSSHPDRKG